MPETFPQDDDGDVLRRLQSQGDDLTQPRDIDFTVIFPDESAAQSFADDIRELGYEVEVERRDVKPHLPWDARIVRNMIPTHEAITEFEDDLDRMAFKYGGQNDGWGCFSQPPSKTN